MRDNSRKTEYVKISEANFPAPFPQQLEFSSPARGTQNIVHTGMLIPEAHEIFVCAKCCLRGVVLTAAEMDAMGRYSALEIREDNVLNGDMEDMMVEGVADIIEKLSYRPKAILIYISCQHFFLAYDMSIVFRRLRERFTDIDFTDCYMIPTLRKSGVTPDQKMRMQMYSLLKPQIELNDKQVNYVGSNLALLESSEIYEYFEARCITLKSIHDCRTYEEYQGLAEGRLNIFNEPVALMGAEMMEKSLGIPHLYLPNVFRFEDLRKNYGMLDEFFGEAEGFDLDGWEAKAAKAVEEAKAVIGDKPIAVDYTLTPRTMNLTRFLMENGFTVSDVFVDALFPEEKDDFEWVKEHNPELIIHPTNRPSMRYVEDLNPEALALGQKAACFMGTDNFVNIAESGGLNGFDGVIQLMELAKDAVLNEKDRREVVQIKGTKLPSVLGGECCVPAPAEMPEVTGKKATASLIPTYSSDQFGICSALYELGGMVVMHDASGCNSTYTTHDEPRWYDRQSMIYISAISEAEAIMGDDDKVINDICDAAAQLNPKFVAIAGAPIPYMIGTDFRAIARVIEKRLGIPCFGFPANGMQGYGVGVAMAHEALAKTFCRKLEGSAAAEGKLKVNLLGATPLDFSINGSIASIKEWCEKEGFEVISSFCMDSSIEEIERAAEADVNLVIAYGGLSAAKYMEAEFGIPYVAGVPYGKLGDAISERIRTGKHESAEAKGAKAVLFGEAVSGRSMAEAIEKEFNIDVTFVCTANAGDEGVRKLLGENDLIAKCEDEVIGILREVKPELVIGDPFYRAIVPETIDFCPLPHEAFSGRIYDKSNPNLIDCSLKEKLEIPERYNA